MIGIPKSSDRAILLALFVFEFLVFRNFYHREISWSIAANYDQCQYLFQSYQMQDAVTRGSLLALPKVFIEQAQVTPQGCLLALEGAISGLIFGGARFPRLLINILAFMALQVFAFVAGRHTGKGRAWGYLMVGLVLCQNSAWFWAGDLFDFRIDFLAYCLYGVLACAALRSNLFLERRWTAVAIFVAILLVLNRFLSLTYVGGTIGAFAVVLAVVWWLKRSDSELSLQLLARLRNILLGAVAVLLVVGPVLLVAKSAIYNYYFVGHVIGGEKYLRLQEAGITNSYQFYSFYPRSILVDHLGIGFGLATAVAILAALVVRGTAGPGPKTTGRLRWLPFAYLLLTIAIPVLALTADMSKSLVVGSIVGGPIALLVMAVLVSMAGPSSTRFRSRAIAIGAWVVCLMGIAHYLDRGNKARADLMYRRDIEHLSMLNGHLGRIAIDSQWSEPKVSVDLNSPWLNAGVARCATYEQEGTIVPFKQLLGGTLSAVPREIAFQQLADSDFVILTTMTADSAGRPVNDSIGKYKADLLAWSEQNLVTLDRFDFREDHMRVYVRPGVNVRGVSGDWISSDGLELNVMAGASAKFPIIQLTGRNASLQYLPHVPVPGATLELEGRFTPA